MDMNFVECNECQKKPGMPVLCDPCLHNRSVIFHLKRTLEAARPSNCRKILSPGANCSCTLCNLEHENDCLQRALQAEKNLSTARKQVADKLEEEINHLRAELKDRADPVQKLRLVYASKDSTLQIDCIPPRQGK